MLDQAEIKLNVGRLIFWVTLTAGVAILAVNLFFYQPGVGLVGLALVMLACTAAMQRTMGSLERALRQGVDIGRRLEREGKITVVP